MDETDLIRDVEQGKAIKKDKKKIKIRDVYEQWHDATKPPFYSNNTWRVYAEFYNRYIDDIYGDKCVNKVTSEHIQKFITIMNEKYSAETVNKCINVLTGIFAYALVVLKVSTQNPVDGIKRNRASVKAKPTWDDAKVNYFLSLPRVQESSYYLMLCVSLFLGPRPEEVCGLAESDLISIPYKALQFDRSYDRYGQIGKMKSDGSHRIVPIPDDLYRAINRQGDRKKAMQKCNQSWGDNDFMFVSINGCPVKPNQYSRAFKRILDSHNVQMQRIIDRGGKLPDGDQILPQISLYGCRHSFATNTMRHTPNAKLVSSIMGNSVKTLLSSYVQSDMKDKKDLIMEYVGLKTVKSK